MRLRQGTVIFVSLAAAVTMKNTLFLLLLLVMSFGLAPESFSAETEVWKTVFDDGRSRADFTLERQDGTVTADGDWTYHWTGSYPGTISGPFTDASVSIAGSSISITASGIATHPSAPAGYQTSRFDLTIGGTAYDGRGEGVFSIRFTTFGWPSSISGSWDGTRTSGGGITAGPEPIPPTPMPWIPLLLLDD